MIWGVPDVGVAATVTVVVPAGMTRTAAVLEAKPAQPEMPAASVSMMGATTTEPDTSYA